MRTLSEFWATYEISMVSLVDIAVWHWMYEHPEATPAELGQAVVQIAKQTWNQSCAPVLGQKDVLLLGIYSHMISYSNYLPDYAIGHLIGFQVEEQIKRAGAVGSEVERMTTYGNVSPDIWMEHATAKPVGAEALLAATARALREVR